MSVKHTTMGLGILGVVMAAAVGARASDVIEDDFEAAAPGAIPGAPWIDVTTRYDNPMAPDPSTIVIDTTDVNGQPTRAAQTVAALQSASGLLLPFSETPRQMIVEATVRIDQFNDSPGITWPIAMGFTQDNQSGNVNGDAHVVLYVSTFDFRWRVFMRNGSTVSDWPLNGGDVVAPGSWHRIRISMNTANGLMQARVFDPVTGTLVAGRTEFAPNWNRAYGRYDAVLFFDGDDTGDGTVAGQATIDDVRYEVVRPACSADLDFDDDVDFGDLVVLLSSFGPCPVCVADIDRDGAIGFTDLIALLASWGPCPDA